MKKNVGKVDKMVRLVLALILAIVGYLTNMWWLFIIVAILVFTTFMGFCGLYTLIGINTCKLPKEKPINKKK